ncbi:DsbA family protein [Variovorax ureilyticus]|uniref:DsbA family protein n=1 Tax=Variovorax ureilyticus TaxID=1836198 RepID=UPI003D672C9F
MTRKPTTRRATLHYVFDPLCGWCYAAAPLVDAARAIPGLKIELHGGGMMTGPNRRPVTPEWRSYVIPHDRRIAELSGQPFGAGYFDGLLNDGGAMLDSTPPLTAVLAAQAVADRGLDMLNRVQRAHYVEGRRIAERPVLNDLAADIGLAPNFGTAFDELTGESTHRHIAHSRQWLARAGGQGFPTFALETPAAQVTPIGAGRFLGQPDAWATQLEQLIAQAL